MKWERTPAPLGPSVTGDGAIDPDDLAPPNWGRVREVMWHVPRLLSGLGPLTPRGPEDGSPALVIPGFLSTDRTTMELRRALARAGWRVHPWLLGLNSGAKANTLDLLKQRIDAIYDGRPVLVVGWSLGGMFARELAFVAPDKVRAAVTLGSPFSGNLKTNTNVREYYERIAGHDVNQPPFPARHGQAAGADAGAVVAQGRDRRAERGAGPSARGRQGGRDRHPPHGVRGVAPGAEPGGGRSARLPRRDRAAGGQAIGAPRGLVRRRRYRVH